MKILLAGVRTVSMGQAFLPQNCSPGLTENLWKGQGDRLQHLRPHLQNFPSLPSSPVLFFLS